MLKLSRYHRGELPQGKANSVLAFRGTEKIATRITGELRKWGSAARLLTYRKNKTQFVLVTGVHLRLQ